MSATTAWRQRTWSLLQWLQGFRYIRFGLVGASGTVVNMLILFLAQEFLFRGIAPSRTRLLASLTLAIAVATVNNFTWNRLWTWADRVAPDQTRLLARAGVPGHTGRGGARYLMAQFARYTLASWLGIALQYGLTLWLSQAMHYLVANLISIVIASVSNYLANDLWTFRLRHSRAGAAARD